MLIATSHTHFIYVHVLDSLLTVIVTKIIYATRVIEGLIHFYGTPSSK